jgi:hypothetical protein
LLSNYVAGNEGPRPGAGEPRRAAAGPGLTAERVSGRSVVITALAVIGSSCGQVTDTPPAVTRPRGWAGRVHGEEMPRSFGEKKDGIRRARPAGPPGRPVVRLGKLFLASAGPRLAWSSDYGQRRAVA